jgi:hypothetical protein
MGLSMNYKHYVIITLMAVLLIALSGCITDSSKAVALDKVKGSATLADDQVRKCLAMMDNATTIDHPAPYFQWMSDMRVEIVKALALMDQTYDNSQSCLPFLAKSGAEYQDLTARMDQILLVRGDIVAGYNELLDEFYSQYGSEYGSLDKL